jgi:hypothetical protein
MNNFKLYILTIISFCAFACKPEVSIVSVEPTTINISQRNQSQSLEAKALTMRGEEVPDIPLTFSSNNTSVATVSADGVIQPVASGNAIISVTTAEGKKAEAFVSVCFPEKIICDPEHVLNLRVGTAAPLRCHLEDCKGNKLPGAVLYEEASKEAVFRDGENTFIGKEVTETSITAKGGGLEKTILVKIEEQIFSPGMDPRKGGGGGGGGGGSKQDREKDPYGDKKAGQFGHILNNINM